MLTNVLKTLKSINYNIKYIYIYIKSIKNY